MLFAVADDLQPVLFDESLEAFSDGSDEVGKSSLSIKSSDDDRIEVKASSSAAINGASCGINISALLSRTGHTLEQNISEYLKVCKKLLP